MVNVSLWRRTSSITELDGNIICLRKHTTVIITAAGLFALVVLEFGRRFEGKHE
jgi:hypothetical protein